MKKKKIFLDPRFLMYHSPTLILEGQVWVCGEYSDRKQEQGIMPFISHEIFCVSPSYLHAESTLTP